MACVYHPTSVMLLDDNYAFMSSIEKELRAVDKHMRCQLYTNPVEALQKIQNLKAQKDILVETVATDADSSTCLPASCGLPVRYDIANLYQYAYDPERFDEISVAVVDFQMPNINGTEFCRQLVGSPVKKIMLTGEADAALAVKLFNEGIIDKFIFKNTVTMERELTSSIIEMQKRYFQDLTSPLTQGLMANKESSLGDPVFIDFFNKVCKDISASSYYLVEPSGSYLFIDDAGLPTWLIIKTKKELSDLTEFMEGVGKISPDTIESIKKGEKIPYFRSSYDYLHSVDDNADMEKYLHKAEMLNGQKEYSYFLTNTLTDFGLDQKRVASFNDFFEKDSVNNRVSATG